MSQFNEYLNGQKEYNKIVLFLKGCSDEITSLIAVRYVVAGVNPLHISIVTAAGLAPNGT